MPDDEILPVYDRESPVCEKYCRMVRIRDSVGKLKLVNARDTSKAMDDITVAGLDVDQGMVLKVGERLYYGSDAIHALALLSSRSGLFNRITVFLWMFLCPDLPRWSFR